MMGFIAVFSRKRLISIVAVTISVGSLSSCFVSPENKTNPSQQPTPSNSATATAGNKTGLAGSSSYTPYDAINMLWSRGGKNRSMVWTNSGGESGKLLVSKADTQQRPDWTLNSQGVLAGLAAKGEKVVTIATVYTSDEAIRPVFRKPKKPLTGLRTLPIPRSSIELALDRLLKREGVAVASAKIPKVEKPSFPTISTLLTKPATDKDALDYAILVEPFITNVMTKYPKDFEIGKGGLYNLHYSVMVRESDLKARRAEYVQLLRELLEADKKIAAFPDDATFYREVWGREKDGKPDLFAKTLTYKRQPAKLQLNITQLRKQLKEELTYLTQKYPNDLKMPENVDALVDPSLLKEVAPDRVIP
jgi:ABC-type nitrate/sulfonate/bicarbonate transport system substrate-binding protein